MYNISIDNNGYKYWRKLQELVYDFRQDLWDICPPKEDETFARTLKVLARQHSFTHGPRHKELGKYFNNFISAVAEFIENSSNTNFDNIRNKIKMWEKIERQMQIIRVAAQKMYSAGDIPPRTYFSEIITAPNFLTDLIKLENLISSIKHFSLEEIKKESDKINGLKNLILRIDTNCFTKDDSLHDDLNYYIHDIVEHVKDRVNNEKWNLKQIGIKIDYEPKSYEKGFVLIALND